MSRYIDADALLEKVQFRVRINDDTDKTIKRCVEITRNLIKNAPTADVAPVVHAKWDVNGHCTNCGGHAPFYCMTSTYYKSPYCFECGAKMDG